MSEDCPLYYVRYNLRGSDDVLTTKEGPFDYFRNAVTYRDLFFNVTPNATHVWIDKDREGVGKSLVRT